MYTYLNDVVSSSERIEDVCGIRWVDLHIWMIGIWVALLSLQCRIKIPPCQNSPRKYFLPSCRVLQYWLGRGLWETLMCIILIIVSSSANSMKLIKTSSRRYILIVVATPGSIVVFLAIHLDGCTNLYYNFLCIDSEGKLCFHPSKHCTLFRPLLLQFLILW